MYKILIIVEDSSNIPSKEEILQVMETELRIMAYQAETYLMWWRGLISREEMIRICTKVLLSQEEDNTTHFSEWLDSQTGKGSNFLPPNRLHPTSPGSTFMTLLDISLLYDAYFDAEFIFEYKKEIEDLWKAICEPVKTRVLKEF